MRCAVTGAAEGIGLSLVRRFARGGSSIIAIDQNEVRGREAESELREMGAQAQFELADLSDGNQLGPLAERLAAAGKLDVLVHNAGINCVGRFDHSDLTLQERLLRVNLTAPIRLTEDLLKRGALQYGSTLVFLSSLSHYVGYPGAAVYAASKDGITSYARSLSVSLAPRGINVLTVFPGPTRTEHARRYSPDNSREGKRMPPAELAERVYRAVARRRRVLVPGLNNQLFAVLGRVLPGASTKMMRKAILDPWEAKCAESSASSEV